MKTIILSLLMLLLGVTACKKEGVNPSKPIDKPITTPDTASVSVIQYIGRYDANFYSGWGGAYVRVNFTDVATVKFSDTKSNNYYVSIDGSSPKLLALDSSKSASIVSAGLHELVISQGKDYYYNFNLMSITGKLSEAASRKWLIEYIGDSITAGYLNPRANIDSYAWQVSEMLGADHVQIAYPGITLVNGMDKQYSSLTATGTTPWSFGYKPNMIVINLGTNDANYKVTQADFSKGYLNFIKALRVRYGFDIPILIMVPFNQAYASTIVDIGVKRKNASDNNTHVVLTKGWLTKLDFNPDKLHPNVLGSIDGANQLKPVIQSYLK